MRAKKDTDFRSTVLILSPPHLSCFKRAHIQEMHARFVAILQYVDSHVPDRIRLELVEAKDYFESTATRKP